MRSGDPVTKEMAAPRFHLIGIQTLSIRATHSVFSPVEGRCVSRTHQYTNVFVVFCSEAYLDVGRIQTVAS